MPWEGPGMVAVSPVFGLHFPGLRCGRVGLTIRVYACGAHGALFAFRPHCKWDAHPGLGMRRAGRDDLSRSSICGEIEVLHYAQYLRVGARVTWTKWIISCSSHTLHDRSSGDAE